MNPAIHGPYCLRRLSYIAPFVVSFTSILLLGVFFAKFHYLVKSPNVDLKGKSFTYLYIPTGTDFKGLLKIMKDNAILKNENSFAFVAVRKHYEKRVKAGKYRIRNGMSNNDLVNQLRSGLQEPVRLSFQTVHTVSELAGKLGRQVEADSASLMKLFLDPSYLKKYDINPDNVFVLFIPNTYEIFWNTTAAQLIAKMSREQKAFWNAKRRMELGICCMNIQQVVTLASIVEKESNKDSEKPDIAGVYINRLRKNWPLQADPTIIYAWQDYTIRRITIKHLKIDSKYNTYTHKGLPPGPICIPSRSSIDAVLNFRNHNYMYFCAREDLSGFHNFAVSLAEHGRNARNYQKAIDQLNIK